MSAYLTLATPMTNRDCLLGALGDLGFDNQKVEVHDTPVSLVGYEGSRRGQTAHVVIRRTYIGSASNDVGFVQTATGYQALVSNYNQRRFGAQWLAQLKTRYDAHYDSLLAAAAEAERIRLEAERATLVEAQRKAVHARARSMGYRVTESRQGDTVRLVLVKRTY